jgi:soluble lytic murein transglycosylase
MKIARLITAILVSIFLFNTTYVLSDNNNDFSKNRVEQARSIFKQIEKGNWSLALKKSKKINNKVLNDLIYWLYLNKKKNNANFYDYQNFITQNTNFPNKSYLQYLSEHKINTESISPKEILNHFKKNEPVSSFGKLRLGEALIASGETERGKKLIKENFIIANLTGFELSHFIKNYSEIIKLKDLIRRAEWLAWENKSGQLRSLMPYLTRDYKALYKARYLLAIRLHGVEYAIKNVPNKYKNNQGLLYQRLQLKIKKDKIDSALNLLLKAKSDKENFNRPDKFWNATSIITRHLVYKKKHLAAYKIASKHHLNKGSNYSEAEWLSGWIALSFLNNPKLALKHFLNMAENAYSPKSRSRAAYWCAKTYEALDQQNLAENWYISGGAYPTTYYGQLSFQKIFPNKKISFPKLPIVSDKIKNDFDNNQWVKAVKILKAINRTKYSKNILIYLSKMDNKPENEFLATKLAMDIGQKNYAIKISKRASKQKRYYLNFNYPIIDVPKIVANKKMPPAELILAVIRQESEFNVTAKSHRGALGIMQIMPDTARDVSKKTKISYNVSKILRNQKYNIRLGSYYLEMMLEKYKKSFPLALAAYNAGHKRVDRWLDINGDPRQNNISFEEWIELIPYKETRNYVQRVLENLIVYKFLI